MPPEVISILVLVAAFAIATTLSVNMGVLCFAAAFLVATVFGGLSEDDIFDGFPGDLFVVLVGVTFLFAIARANGTTDWVVQRAVRMVGGRIALIPWVMFGIGAVLTAIGAVSPAAVAIVAPIALNLAARYKINPLLMGAMVVHGTQAGGFSPISIYGGIVNEVVANSGLPGSPVALFLGSFAANAVIAGVVFVVFGGLRLRRATEARQLIATGSGGTGGAIAADDRDEDLRLNRDRVLTLAGLAVLVITTLGFGLDVGLMAMSIAVVLSVVSPKMGKAAPAEVAWPTVLLICGVLTYVGVLEKMGTIDYVGHSVAGIGVPLLAALLLCYIGAIVSAFASSVGIMGALIPLAVPFLQSGSVGPIGMITAFAVAATVVDVSPFSTNGAIVLANAKDVDKDSFFRQLLVYGGVIVVAAPLALWILLVLPHFG
ncbi:SLC13 family permease [Saccharopolyspora flava]|uniref:Transporter, UIT1 family (TC 9.B.48) n=1 Tax=Saccharopolyspora flava TaxID=95161 RepID=A0A1I6S6L0_9PSEU|nr:SLC13 family permease [Saccharopolyspora flava]SFS72629.1 transporter, UIT1 family (TC 9.B.48) [Saccharopolyspora flava]